MQLQSEAKEAQSQPNEAQKEPQRSCEIREEDIIFLQDLSRQRLLDESRRRNLTPIQVIHLAKAGNHDISEATIRNFYDPDYSGEPTSHTIEVLSKVIFGTEREDYDPSKAYQYYCECVESRISATNSMQHTVRVEAQCESLAARLKAYEDAIGFYRSQLEAAAREREMLLKMIGGNYGKD